MKKKCLWKKASLLFSLPLLMCALLTGCTSLSYQGDDADAVKRSNIQTKEAFSITTYEKPLSSVQTIKAGISETELDTALMLYIGIKNGADIKYKFDLADMQISSPIGEVSVIPPNQYIDAYQSFETANYANLAGMSTTLGQFANIQNQYRRTTGVANDTRFENSSITPELVELNNKIKGIQSHTVITYKFVNPHSEEYFYIFLRKPEEYPIVVKYKDLTYKFGGKKNAEE